MCIKLLMREPVCTVNALKCEGAQRAGWRRRRAEAQPIEEMLM